MTDYRLMFKKEGRAVYISHLDLMRTMQRAFARAGLKVKHSEGFNPHPRMVFAMPLSLGASSDCELVDFTLVDELGCDEVTARLEGMLPEGISAVKTWHPVSKLRDLAVLEAEAVLEYDSAVTDQALEAIKALFAGSELLIEKKTKRGRAQTDILPLIKSVSFKAEGNAVKMHCTVRAQEPSLNPALIVKAIETHLPAYAPVFTRLKRLAMYKEDGTLFI